MKAFTRVSFHQSSAVGGASKSSLLTNDTAIFPQYYDYSVIVSRDKETGKAPRSLKITKTPSPRLPTLPGFLVL